MVEPVRLAVVNPDTSFAKLAQRAFTMGDHDQAGVVGQFFEGGGGFVFKGGVAGGGDFVGDVNVKVKRQRQAKLKARLHAAGVAFDGVVKGIADFGKILNESHALCHVGFMAVHAADKPGVLPAGERALQTAPKTHGPRNAAVPLNTALVGLVDTANDAQQGGLAGTVGTDEANAKVAGNVEADASQDPLAGTLVCLVALMHIVNNDHCVTNRKAKRRCKAKPKKILTSAHPYI